MHSMAQQANTLVVGGVDSHADSHHAAVLDQRGALLETKRFPMTAPGYRQLLEWLRGYGKIDVIAIESTGSYAAALERYLREHDVTVVEVNQPHPHSRRRVAKSDPVDAEMAACLFFAGKAKSVLKQTDAIVESIRLLRVARDSAVKSRSAALVQIRDLIITAHKSSVTALRSQDTARQSDRIRGVSPLSQRPWLPKGREFESLRARYRSPAGVSAIVPSTEPFGGPADRPGREAYEHQLAEGAKSSFEQPARGARSLLPVAR